MSDLQDMATRDWQSGFFFELWIKEEGLTKTAWQKKYRVSTMSLHRWQNGGNFSYSWYLLWMASTRAGHLHKMTLSPEGRQ